MGDRCWRPARIAVATGMVGSCSLSLSNGTVGVGELAGDRYLVAKVVVT